MDTESTKRWLRYFVAFRGLSLMPERVAYRLASHMGDLDLRRENAWAESFASGLRLAFPSWAESRISASVRAHFRMMAREVLDVFYLPRRREQHLGKVIFPSGFEVLEHAKQGGKGTIIAMAHFGRPIMLSTALGLSGHRIGILSQAVDERNPDLSSVDSTYLQNKLLHTVAKAGGRGITTKDNLRVLYNALDQGETIIIMLDVVEPDAEKRFKAPFLGGILGVPRGIVRLASKTGARLIYGVAKDQGHTVATELRALPPEPGAAMTAAILELEKDVLEAPWQWWQWRQLNHFWGHAP